MKFRKRIAPSFFLVLSLIFALASIPFGAALNRINLDRTATAKVAEDKHGVLRLEGFENRSHNVNHNYSNVGSITNNTNQVLALNVTIAPDFSWNYNPLCVLGIKIGDQTREFNFLSREPKQVTLTLNPGQKVNVRAVLTLSLLSTVTTSFEFTASDAAGTYTMNIKDTANTPRRMIFY